ncbi:Speckle-type POZ protein-like protein [Panicum miliaceum]|uniref:Speckle-type POZ protein-like protein n=1 Tax=Panicum miliaceum TaxID=4540 RepID=A0A3L6Q988_PANMI|nr:Speckle-type POZ protein-like protein [Panicum miliaceum]
MANASASSANDQSLPETSSSCLTQGATAAHNFEVINFPLLEGMGVGKFVSSINFSVGGCDWMVKLFPDGDRAAEKTHVLSYLSPQGGQAGERVKFSLSVLGKDGQVAKQQNGQYTFVDSAINGVGWSNFIEKSSLQQVLCSSNNRFTIRCVLTVIKPPRVEDVVSAIAVPESNLLRDLASMLKLGESADVTFSVGGQLFPAHRCVLAARSPVFRAELLGPMKEKAARHIKVDDMEPSTFERSSTSSIRILCRMAATTPTEMCRHCSTCWSLRIGMGWTG